MRSVLLRYKSNLLEIIFFLGIFILSIKPLRDFDIWFHVKSGEVIAKMGIIHYDVFSYTAAGRQWIPYEWLFQLTVYFIQQIFSFEVIKYFIAMIVLLQIWLFYLILRKIFKLNTILSILTSFLFFISIYEFYDARPHVVAYTILIAVLYLLLLYYKQNKNFLYISFPLIWIWGNLHGSMFLGVGLFAAFALINLIEHFIYNSIQENRERKLTDELNADMSSSFRGNPDRKVEGGCHKEKLAIKKFRVLTIYTILSALVTISPPLYLLQYRLLWIFFKNQAFISRFIDEWTPLALNPVGFWIYTGTLIPIVVLSVALIIKKKNIKEFLWAVPILPFTFLAYSASRNVFLGNIAIFLVLGFLLTKVNFANLSKKLKSIFILVTLLIVGINIWLLKEKMIKIPLYYPVNAVSFIKKYDLQGNMFNEYGYGGYILYKLYPEKKVFFDGRTDVYLCCEMRDVFEITIHKNDSDENFRKLLYDKLWNKYNISYVFLRTEKNNLQRKIMRILEEDPSWALIFWDDYTEILVRKDGKNDEIIKNFEAKYATPYLKDPFVKGKKDAALEEYIRMEKIVKSARTSNAIGYILLQKSQFDEAKFHFQEAIGMDANFESPYMNLGELAAHAGDYNQAIELYEKAQKLSPDRSLIYIRLGQLFIEGYKDYGKAKKIWTEGVKQTFDENAKKTLIKLISDL